MRSIVTSLLLLLAAAPAVAATQATHAPASAANLLRFHPGPWSPPVALRAGMRFDPENGEATVADGSALAASSAQARSITQAEARRIAAANVRTNADGSRHAFVGSAFRSYVVVSIGDDGRLTQDCVSSETQAQARVDAARKQVRK